MKLNKIKSVFMLTAVLAMCAILFGCSKVDVRDDYVGSYRTDAVWVENGQEQKATYTLTIVKSSTNENDIILNNINGWNESVRATVSGNAMTIPQQTIQQIGISGSGTLNGNVLNFSVMFTETGGTPVNAIQTAIKQ